MNSLKIRLSLGALIGTLLIAGACGGFLYYLLQDDLYDRFDDALTARARALGALAEFDEDGYSFEAFGEVGDKNLPRYFVIRQDGKVVATSKSMRKEEYQWPDTDGRKSVVRRIRLDDDRARAAVVRVLPRTEPKFKDQAGPIEVLVAEKTDDIEEELARFALLIALAGGAAVMLGVGAIWLVVPRALSPLSRVARTIGELDVNALKPLDAGPVPAELAPVVAQLDALIERMNETLRREQEFSAGAAHELRTPLAGMRAKLELALSKPRTPEEHKAMAQSALEIAERMQALISNLMLFARAGQPQGSPPPAPVDIGALLRDEWQPHDGRARSRKLEVIWKLEEGALTTRADLLKIIVANLYDNAVSYANEGGQIEIAWQGGVLAVSNTGCKLAPADAQRVFEPFWRADESRTGETHAGLGLAICKRIASALGAKLAVEAHDGIFVATLALD